MTDHFIDIVFKEATKRIHTRFWLISDLQQGSYKRAERYMSIAVNDLNKAQLVDFIMVLYREIYGIILRYFILYLLYKCHS